MNIVPILVLVSIVLMFVVGILLSVYKQNNPVTQESSYQQSDGEDESQKYQWIYVGKKAVESILKDPDSARFSMVAPSKIGGIVVVCGNVNSKNSFGGYTGEQRFISGGKSDTTFLERSVSGFDDLWTKYCYK